MTEAAGVAEVELGSLGWLRRLGWLGVAAVGPDLGPGQGQGQGQ